MRRMMAVCNKELQAYFLSPTSYFAFAVYVLMTSLLFYSSFVYYQPSIVDYRLVSGRYVVHAAVCCAIVNDATGCRGIQTGNG